MHLKQEKREGMVIKKERFSSILQAKAPLLVESFWVFLFILHEFLMH